MLVVPTKNKILSDYKKKLLGEQHVEYWSGVKCFTSVEGDI